MTDVQEQQTSWNGELRVWTSGLILGLLLCLIILPATAAAKPYEVVGTFGGVAKAGEVSEEAQLNGVSALAVNHTGAGGVAKGTVYAVTHANGANHVARFTPEANGLKFEERWEVTPPSLEKAREEAATAPYAICGPAAETEGLSGEAHCTMSREGAQGGLGIAVDQTTGNVYVGDEPNSYPTGEDVIHEYTPNGAAVVAHFGEKGPVGPGHTVGESPDQIHESTQPGWLTINDAGEVFVFDLDSFDNFHHRLMVFKPKPLSNHTEYEYAGQAHDIGAGSGSSSNYPEDPVVDEAGNVYVKSDNAIEEYDPATPGAPICTFFFNPAGISAMTVDPKSGEPFFYSYRKESRRLYELSSCKNGAFTRTGEFGIAPERSEVYSLTFDPTRQFQGREPGAIYAGAAGPVPVVGKGQPETSGLGYVIAQPAEFPPAVMGESVSEVTAGSALLTGQLDPHGFPTRYAFQYLTQAAFAVGGFSGAAEIGGAVEGSGARQVVAAIAALEPDTVYVFRLVATSHCSAQEPAKECRVEGPPTAFPTYPAEATGPPDGRAYELVSPAQKQGGQVLPADPIQKSCLAACKPGEAAERFPAESSPDGESVVYQGEPFGFEGAEIENEYLSRRSASGWTTADLTPGRLVNRDGNGYKAFTPELTSGVFGQGALALTPSALGGYRNLYVQPTGEFFALTPLLSVANAEPTCLSGSDNGSLRLTYAGSSSDLSRIFFEANDALTASAAGPCEQSNLYEWTGGVLRAVNIPLGMTQTVPKAVYGSGLLLQSGNPNSPSATVSHAISDDGARAFFTGADGRLYVRVDGVATLQVPSPGNCDEATPLGKRVCFLTASADGRRVILSNGQILSLNESGTQYELSVDLPQGGGGFLGIAGQSEDLSHVFFVDTAALGGSGGNGHGGSAETGKNNLYAWINGQTQFIAQLSSTDGFSRFLGDWAASPVLRTAEASSDGRWLAFQSISSLTGYENAGYTEAFVYDSQTHDLTCASCNPGGSRPVGPTTLRTDYNAKGYLRQPRYLTDDGRLIFDSSDRLVPGDTNGKVEDVYEFEPAGVGGCAGSGHCVSLVSAGRGSADSNFLAMNEGTGGVPAGADIFFTTRDKLVKADTDELVDLYDAKVGGGLPELQSPGECSGEACQAPTAVPSQLPPSSMSITSEAVSKQPHRGKCKKGQYRQHGHCTNKKKNKHRPHLGPKKSDGKGTKSKHPHNARHNGGNR
jgi:hypothetical protein